MSCSGSYLGITINIKNKKFVKDLPMIDVSTLRRQTAAAADYADYLFKHKVIILTI
jgi:hypothetical protein